MGKKLTRSSVNKINKELEEVLTQDDIVHTIEDNALPSKVLSQKAGKELVEKIEKKVDIDNIVDDLETEDNKLPLSAQQGVELKRMIEDTVRKLIQQGSISIKINDGTGDQEILLDSPNEGLLVPKDCWHELYNFAENTIVMAFSSTEYLPGKGNYVTDKEEFLKNCQ